MQMPNVPTDPKVKIGKLENGLTYYIRHNEWPEQRADFYIAQKVGSMQEEEDQRGLAHFLEHMCFNGTKHFPGDGLKSYLETIGVKFGADLNAYTSFDETVYNINNVPVKTNPASLDSCLLILHDWSNALLLSDTEIDKERGVINEEWRLRSTAQQRIYEACFPTLYEGSKYANRMPIGTMDVVMNFKYETLRNYYRKWYRPDLQGIVIVGDVDVDEVEQKIKAVFADVKAPVNPAERVYFQVPNNVEPVVAVARDKEQPRSMCYIMWKQEKMPVEQRSTMLYVLNEYVQGAIEEMLSLRINELTRKANPPFISAGAGYGDFLVSKTKDMFTGMAIFADNGHKDAIKALYREILRAYRHGFTEAEYLRFKDEMKSQLENEYNKRDKITNTSLAVDCYTHFLDNEPMPSVEWKYQTLPALADQIPLQVINQAFQSDTLSRNLNVFMMLPDKENIVSPTKDEIVSILKEVEAEDIEAYVEEVSNEPLVDVAKLQGSKVSKIADAPYDSKLITLKNGVKIYVKKTDYKPNNISFSADSWGGSSLYGKDDVTFLNVNFANNMSLGGWGEFSATDLIKKMSGKQASCGAYINKRNEGLSGSCVTKDLETLLQLVYLQFTAPRKDTEAYASYIQRTKSQLENAAMQPTTALQDTLMSVIYKNDIRARRSKVEDLEKLDYDKSIQYYKERFANAADFDFFFVGDIDIEAATPLFEQYLGSLPVSSKKENYKPIDLQTAKGTIDNIFQKKQETPMAYCVLLYTAPMKKDLKKDITISMLDQIMDIVFTQTVREDEGGSYSVSCSSSISEYPEEQAMVQIVLPTAPAKREKMTDIIYKGIDQLTNEGPKAEDLQKVREYMLRSHDEEIKTNGYWLGSLETKVREGKEYVKDYVETVNAITAADIQQMAKTIFKSGNRINVSMTDDSKTE